MSALLASFPAVGTWPQWLSGVAAFSILVGAGWLILHSGRRANIYVSGVVEGSLLLVTVRMVCVGRLPVSPIGPKVCGDHGCEVLGEENGTVPNAEISWLARTDSPSASTRSTQYADKAQLADYSKSVTWFGWWDNWRKWSYRRMNVWACPNQMVPCLQVFELRNRARVGPDFWDEIKVFEKKNVFHHNFLESGEEMQFAHAFPVDCAYEEIFGWRVTARVWSKRWNWYHKVPGNECWWWTSTVVVPRPN